MKKCGKTIQTIVMPLSLIQLVHRNISSVRDGKDHSDERFVAVLEIPPVVSLETAVKVAIVAEVRGKK